MEERMERLEAALIQSSTVKTAHPSNLATVDIPMNNATSLIPPGNDASAQNPSDRPGKVTLNLSCSLGAFPAASITDVTFANDPLDSTNRPDLISSNVITLNAANDFFEFYRQYLDPHMHYLLSETDSLATIRARSSLLTAAMCTVATFCTGSKDYQNCFQAFMNEVSRKLFADKYEFDDVRALAVGALWLNDISSALNGLGKRLLFSIAETLDRC